MAETPLAGEVVQALADRFKALGEPARLRILDALREGERTVSEIVEATSLRQANVSRHLGVLHTLGFVRRRKEKQSVYYALAGEDVFRLCDMMCDRIEGEAAGLTRSRTAA